jgi:hypothetical protein
MDERSKHAEIVEWLVSCFAVDRAKVEDVLAQTNDDLNAAAEILCRDS